MKKAVEIKKDIFWTGALDYDIRVFDIIMRTEYGTTYNAYVVKGTEKTALIETSKGKFFDEFLERVSSVTNPKDINYIILNHTEPDHAGALARLAEICPDTEIIGSQAAVRFIRQITNTELKTRVVLDGETIDLGGKTLEFISAPFLHWPDSMFTYLKEQKTLFSCDFLGCHYCSDEITNAKLDFAEFADAYKYYFDMIMGPFKSYVRMALDRIGGFDIETVCVGHGPVLVKDMDKYTGLYRGWAEAAKSGKPAAAVLYVTAYGYTGELASKIADGLAEAGVTPYLLNLIENNIDDVMNRINESKGVLIGSPTIVGDTLPPVWDVLSRLNPVIHKGMLAGAFGSFGWSGEAVPNIEGRLNQLKLKMPLSSLKVNFKPGEDDLEKAFEFGKSFGAELLK